MNYIRAGRDSLVLRHPPFAGFGKKLEHVARLYDANACTDVNDAGLPYSLLLEPRQLMTAQMEYKKVEATASNLDDLAQELASLDPYSNCPACGEVPGDFLEDGEWLD